MSAFSNQYFNQMPKSGNIVSHYNVHYQKNSQKGLTFIEQTYENIISKWHLKKYKDIAITTTISNKTTLIKYHTQFVLCKIEITERPILLNDFQVDGITVSVSLEKLFSRLQTYDYEELLKLIQQINKLVYKDSKEYNEMIDEEIQELCGIEYAMDHSYY
jgi:hypothetical protein